MKLSLLFRSREDKIDQVRGLAKAALLDAEKECVQGMDYHSGTYFGVKSQKSIHVYSVNFSNFTLRGANS